MAGETSEKQEPQLLSPETLFIPKGYTLITVGAERPSEIEPHCASCGAPVSFFWTECGYCATPKPYLRYIREGEIVTEHVPGLSPGKTIVSKREIHGQIESVEVDVMDHAEIGAIFAETVTLGDACKVGSITSVETISGEKCSIQEVISQHVDVRKGSVLGQVTVMNEGSLIVGKSTVINNLRLGENVKLPRLPRGASIGHIERGSFQILSSLLIPAKNPS